MHEALTLRAMASASKLRGGGAFQASRGGSRRARPSSSSSLAVFTPRAATGGPAAGAGRPVPAPRRHGGECLLLTDFHSSFSAYLLKRLRCLKSCFDRTAEAREGAGRGGGGSASVLRSPHRVRVHRLAALCGLAQQIRHRACVQCACHACGPGGASRSFSAASRKVVGHRRRGSGQTGRGAAIGPAYHAPRNELITAAGRAPSARRAKAWV